MSRAPFIPRETLEPLIRTHRAQGMTWKEIARLLGCYHPTYLSLLGATWNNGSIDCAEAIAREPAKTLRFAAEGASQPAISPAASEAKPSDTQLPGSH